ncbi:dihydrolipoyllysine-residue acetyltransferase [Sodalis endosymbiont of Henestaris halophilus]|uniref:dihydrolipoyllysine-residue acetyltransferase n=1 Tax=Sodalis endosymbiont of Henestaris halophilus TaxID=1929246 RepID=UPI000BC08E01|nr:dihydrolipoyllysine-residue acetyltransferase [Sodalis endosymbiont of Henestaris halophilus]SNC58911.1 Dihydrolipoyllysine-residue acetyltransferase component of pyruvate dehydrogenase complex [Sodalis endosymbiont of Henestaris halophilus]
MAIEINVPDIGADEVEVTEVLVSVGNKVKTEQSLITLEGDKASIDVPAPFAGTVKEIKINVGDKVSTGSFIMVLEVEDHQPDVATGKDIGAKTSPALATNVNKIVTSPALLPAQSKGELADNDAYVHATPVIRRLARKLGVNLSKVKGTGRKGRILREDIQEYVKNMVKRTEDADTRTLPILLSWPKVNFSEFGDTKEVDLSRIQKISGANLHRNWVLIPHVTQFDEADITELEVFRTQQNAEFKKKQLDVKITLLVFIMKAVGKALEELPRFNSSLSDNVQKLILKQYINIGVAVETPNGLVVPVFRDVNKKGIVELSRELTEISKKARAGNLPLSYTQGGCFTISSLGGIGGTAFTPIINAPEVAILGISRSSMKQIWRGKEFEPRLMLPLSLSYDHRVIDGGDGARFISCINQITSDIRCLVM